MTLPNPKQLANIHGIIKIAEIFKIDLSKVIFCYSNLLRLFSVAKLNENQRMSNYTKLKTISNFHKIIIEKTKQSLKKRIF